MSIDSNLEIRFVLAASHGLWDLSSATLGWTLSMEVKVPRPNHWTSRKFFGNYFWSWKTFAFRIYLDHVCFVSIE